MHQPEVTRLLFLVLAVVLAAPVARATHQGFLTGAFLAEFLSDPPATVLTRVTDAPRRMSFPRVRAVDRYAAPGLGTPTPLVLVHGFTPAGKEDPRVQHAAGLLARAGFEVAVPSLPGLMRGRLRPEDTEPVVAAIEAVGRGRAVTLIAVSIGAGPALLAAADPRVRDRVAMAVILGGYASAHELVRFFLTGDYAWGAVRGHIDHDPDVVHRFVAANADLVDEPTRQAIENGDRARIAAFLAAPPAGLRGLLDALSPIRVAEDVEARLLLVHGRQDRAVPYTESLRLAAARPASTTVVLVGSLGHVGGRYEGSRWGTVQELWRLWLGLYALRSAS